MSRVVSGVLICTSVVFLLTGLSEQEVRLGERLVVGDAGAVHHGAGDAPQAHWLLDISQTGAEIIDVHAPTENDWCAVVRADRGEKWVPFSAHQHSATHSFKIKVDGHALKFEAEKASTLPFITSGILGSAEYSFVDGRIFLAGTESGPGCSLNHTIDGKCYAAEIHLAYRREKTDDSKAALNAEHAYVAILLDDSNHTPSPLVDALLAPLKDGKSDKQLSLKEVMPVSSAYYQYRASDGDHPTLWTVFKTPLLASDAQLKSLAGHLHSGKGQDSPTKVKAAAQDGGKPHVWHFTTLLLNGNHVVGKNHFEGGSTWSYVNGEGNIVSGTRNCAIGNGNLVRLGDDNTIKGDENKYIEVGVSHNTISGNKNKFRKDCNHNNVTGDENDFQDVSSYNIVVGSKNEFSETSSHNKVNGNENSFTDVSSYNTLTGSGNRFDKRSSYNTLTCDNQPVSGKSYLGYKPRADEKDAQRTPGVMKLADEFDLSSTLRRHHLSPQWPVDISSTKMDIIEVQEPSEPRGWCEVMKVQRSERLVPFSLHQHTESYRLTAKIDDGKLTFEQDREEEKEERAKFTANQFHSSGGTMTFNFVNGKPQMVGGGSQDRQKSKDRYSQDHYITGGILGDAEYFFDQGQLFLTSSAPKHTIDGKVHAAEVHLAYHSADSTSESAYIAIPIDSGNTASPLVDALMAAKNGEKSAALSLKSVMPTSAGYFQYRVVDGNSHTVWTVFKEALHATSAQLEILSKHLPANAASHTQSTPAQGAEKPHVWHFTTLLIDGNHVVGVNNGVKGEWNYVEGELNTGDGWNNCVIGKSNSLTDASSGEEYRKTAQGYVRKTKKFGNGTSISNSDSVSNNTVPGVGTVIRSMGGGRVEANVNDTNFAGDIIVVGEEFVTTYGAEYEVNVNSFNEIRGNDCTLIGGAAYNIGVGNKHFFYDSIHNHAEGSENKFSRESHHNQANGVGNDFNGGSCHNSVTGDRNEFMHFNDKAVVGNDGKYLNYPSFVGS